MIPYHCDALLPEIERYASPKFRRVAQWFRPTRMDFEDAVELCAFVRTVDGPKFAGIILHWSKTAYKAYQSLEKHPPLLDYVHAAHQANLASLDVETGLAVLRALQDGGWTQGRLPKVVRQAIAELRGRGMSVLDIARLTGLTRWQAEWLATNRQDARRRKRARAAASLAM